MSEIEAYVVEETRLANVEHPRTKVVSYMVDMQWMEDITEVAEAFGDDFVEPHVPSFIGSGYLSVSEIRSMVGQQGTGEKVRRDRSDLYAWGETAYERWTAGAICLYVRCGGFFVGPSAYIDSVIGVA